MNSERVVIGTWPLSGDYGKIDGAAVVDILNYCYESGFMEYDTAPSYGNGLIESRLGEAFGGKDALINTKVGNIPLKGKSFKVQDMRQSVDDSLKRLQKKSINTLFLHNPRAEVTDYNEMFEFMDGLKSENKIKYSGISLAKGHVYDAKTLAQFDYIQDDFNLLAMGSLKYADGNKFMARSPLASGILSGRLTPESVFPGDDHRSGWLTGERLASLLRRVDAIREVSDVSLPSLAKRFVLCNKKVDKAIFGVKRKEHVDSILEDLKSPPLDAEVQKKLVELYESDFGLVNERQFAY